MTGLYFHIPFCLRKCPYCDFFSVPHQGSAVSDYVKWLGADLQQTSSRCSGPVSTLFFGGGTPSLLAPEEVGRILGQVEEQYGFAAGAEISLEANPGTLDPAKLLGYRQAGITRLSLGLQSLDNARLSRLGRLHDAEAGVRAVSEARAAGFDNISCDLMFALPGQTVQDLANDLDCLLELDPEHVAVYGLSVEAGTPFAGAQARGTLTLPEEEDYVAAYRLLHDQMQAAGYEHYEISNFAKPGRRCRHNQRYWQRLPVVGLGAGAHSFCAREWGSRLAVPNDLPGYQADLRAGRDPARLIEQFDRQGAMAETLYLGLRTADGVNADDFSRRFGCRVEAAFPRAVERCRPQLSQIDGHWRFDLDGWLLFDTLLMHFF